MVSQQEQSPNEQLFMKQVEKVNFSKELGAFSSRKNLLLINILMVFIVFILMTYIH